MKSNAITRPQAMRYSRQISLAGFDLEKQEILINSRALIIGAGGLGCAASQYLVAAGVGQVTIVDDDIVENSNLQRQVLHNEETIGYKKVDSAGITLNKLNHFVKVTTIDTRLSPSALLSSVQAHDIVLDCSDNLSTRNLLNDTCYKANIPLVSGAAIRMEGQVFCMIPAQKSACYRCLSHFFGEQNLSCVESGVMSPVVGVIGTTQAIEAIKMLTNYGKPAINKLQLFDAMASHWESFIVPPIANCKTCSRV